MLVKKKRETGVRTFIVLTKAARVDRAEKTLMLTHPANNRKIMALHNKQDFILNWLQYTACKNEKKQA